MTSAATSVSSPTAGAIRLPSFVLALVLAASAGWVAGHGAAGFGTTAGADVLADRSFSVMLKQSQLREKALALVGPAARAADSPLNSPNDPLSVRPRRVDPDVCYPPRLVVSEAEGVEPFNPAYAIFGSARAAVDGLRVDVDLGAAAPAADPTDEASAAACAARFGPSPNRFASVLRRHFGSKCVAPRMSWDEFVCTARCAAVEPELERTVRHMRFAEHGAFEHVVSMCARKVAPALVRFRAADASLRVLRCTPELPEAELAYALRLMAAALCLVELPFQRDFVLGFDPHDYAAPSHHAPEQPLIVYLHPLPGLVRFVGTTTHSALLFPTSVHVAETAHCDFRTARRWWRVCRTHDDVRDALPFAARNRTLLWRGGPAGIPWKPTAWRFHPRARLVREFGTRQGFDVGFVRDAARSFEHYDPAAFADKAHGDALREEVAREARVAPLVSKRDHPRWAHLLHVDGATASWDLSHKVNSGSTVVWVESDHGYREHFHALLRPWEHFVPVAPDMSDLDAARQWLWANPGEAERVARRAAKLVDERMRPEDLYCYVARLLGSIAAAQTRGPPLNDDSLRAFLGNDTFAKFEVVGVDWV